MCWNAVLNINKIIVNTLLKTYSNIFVEFYVSDLHCIITECDNERETANHSLTYISVTMLTL